MPKPKLTEKQRRFIDAYMGDAAGNATQAARLAGYKGAQKTLQSVGKENLRKPLIANAIRDLAEKDPAVATRIDRQRLWTHIMWDDQGETTRDRLRASELLGKSQADFIDRTSLETPGGEPFKLIIETSGKPEED